MTRPLVEVERKHALVNVGPHDYLLVSNDERTLWRLTTYIDGPSMGLAEWPRDRTFWGVWRYIGPLRWQTGELTEYQVEQLLDWSDWDGPNDLHLTTRRAAMVDALRSGPRV